MSRTKKAEKIIQEKTVHDMTDKELNLVESQVKMAWFEEEVAETKGPAIDLRKRAMGEWALKVLKEPDLPPKLKAKIKHKYADEMKYYLEHKQLPEPSKQSKKFAEYLADIEFERQSREIVDIVNN